MEEKKNSVVAIFNTQTEAEQAVRELQRSGFDMKKLSIKDETSLKMNNL